MFSKSESGIMIFSVPEGMRRSDVQRYQNCLKILSEWFEKRNLPASILETRAGEWLLDINPVNFLTDIDLLIRNGDRDNWNEVFPDEFPITEMEWTHILTLQNTVLKKENRALVLIPQTRRKFRELAIGSALGALSLWLFIAYIRREPDKIPPWIQSLTPEELEQLEQWKKQLDAWDISPLREL